MSAHHQEYAFSVSIHALWGNLLAGFAICRILTYTFLHLRPPASILPSRPPTEALGAFCLCAGGIVFMLSTEEVIFWAMRHGFDDMMTFLNATVAFVCAVLSWTLVLMALKGALNLFYLARALHLPMPTNRLGYASSPSWPCKLSISGSSTCCKQEDRSERLEDSITDTCSRGMHLHTGADRSQPLITLP